MTELLINPSLSIIWQDTLGYAATYGHLRFLVSTKREADGKEWLHASVSRSGGDMPTYDDLTITKRLCIGEHKTALQVFPPKDKHVDYASKRGVEVLHLWSCMNGDVTPDFTIDRPKGVL